MSSKTVDLEQLKQNVKLVDYIGMDKLKKTGPDTYRLDPCPVCEKRDHFTIYPGSNSFSSFNDCCSGGSVIDYFIQVEGLDQDQAISKLKRLAGVDDGERRTRQDPESKKMSDTEKKETLSLIEKARQIPCNYYYNRGLTDKTIKKYSLGYLPDGCKYGKAFKYVLPVSNDFIILRGDNDQDRYRNIGSTELFNARYLEDPDLTGRHIFITEGIFDALSLEELDRPAVALNSTAMTKTLIEILEQNKSKLQDKVFILCLDNDHAGEKTEEEIKKAIEALNLACIAFNFEGYKDINEYLQNSRNGLLEALESIPLQGSSYEYLESLFEAEQVKRLNEPEILTGIPSLDHNLGGGLYPGLYVLGSISSLGKTALALQMADRIAAQQQHVLFFSLEMARYEMACRSLTRELFEQTRNREITTGHVLKSNFKGDDLYTNQAFQVALQAYKEGPARYLHLTEGNFDIDVNNLRQYIKEHIARTGQKPVVFIDYLQVIKPIDLRLSEKQTIDYNIIELKRMARDLETPVITVSSFNRDAYNGPATFKAFKESGSIEYTADVVLAMQLRNLNEKDDVNELKNREPRPLELVVLKNRRGKAFEKITLDYWPKQNYFHEA